MSFPVLKKSLTVQHLYHKRLEFKNKRVVSFFAPKIWRIMYLISSNSVHHTSEKRIRTRSSTIPVTFNSFEVYIYTGKRWCTRRINKWLVGFKFGEFTWNRKFAVFKAKQKRKKSKKN